MLIGNTILIPNDKHKLIEFLNLQGNVEESVKTTAAEQNNSRDLLSFVRVKQRDQPDKRGCEEEPRRHVSPKNCSIGWIGADDDAIPRDRNPRSRLSRRADQTTFKHWTKEKKKHRDKQQCAFLTVNLA